MAKACSDGGQRKAIEMMQTFVKRAAAEGFVFDCEDCHPEEPKGNYFKLAPEADARGEQLHARGRLGQAFT